MAKNKLIAGEMKASAVKDLRTIVTACIDWNKVAGTKHQIPVPWAEDLNIRRRSRGLYETVWLRNRFRLEKRVSEEKWEEICRISDILDDPKVDSRIAELEYRVKELEEAR